MLKIFGREALCTDSILKNMHEKKALELENSPVGRLMWRYFWPSFIGVVANSLYNIVDRIFIGQFIGAKALSGITAVFPVMVIMMAFGMLIGLGSSVQLSIFMGRKDYTKAQRVLGNAVVLVVIISALVTGLGFLIKDPMLRLFGATDTTIGYANEYLNYILWGVVLHEFGFSLNAMIRAEGNARIAMYSMLISAGVNIPLDALFIIHFKMGVQGAALATIISMAVLSAWVLIHFRSKRCVIPLKRQYIGINKTILLSILSVGLSPFLMQLANSVVQALLNINLIKYGSDLAVGAMGIIMSVTVIIVMSIVALNMASQPIIGYNYGARNYSRVKQAFGYGLRMATLFAVVAWILVESFPVQIVRVFIGNSPEMMDYGTEGLRLYLLMLPFVGFQVVVGNYYQSVGKAGKAIFLSLLRQVILFIPMLLVLPGLFGLKGVWLSAPISDFISSIISLGFVISEWRKLSRHQ